MFEFDIGRFVKANHALGVWGQMLVTQQQNYFARANIGQPTPPITYTARAWLGWKEHAQAIAEIADAADLPITKRQAQALIAEMERFQPKY